MKPHHQRTLVMTFGITLILWGFIYAQFYRGCIVSPQSPLPRTYKQFLLEKTEGPRIIVESGSNALHSIQGKLMEELSGYPTIILSDHAGASLHDKIRRLQRFAKKGDIVLLPLEWNYYHYDDLGKVHLLISLDKTSNYFWSLPVIEQWMRAFQTPVKMVIEQLLSKEPKTQSFYSEELKRFHFFNDHNYQKAPHGGLAGTRPKIDPDSSVCDKYILPELASGPVSLSKDFIKNIGRLKSLERKGVKVIILPPVVAGNDCYENYSESLDVMLSDAKKLFDRHHLKYLLDYRKYSFSGEYIQDTHFHINEKAREIYTPLIFNDLVESHWLEPKQLIKEQRITNQIPRLLAIQKLELLKTIMPEWRGNPTAIVDGDDREYMFFGNDWYDEENRGRWAKSKCSQIIFRPTSPEQVSGIYVNAFYYKGSQKTQVYINEELVAEQDFDKNHLIDLNGTLKNWMGTSKLVQLRFKSKDLVKPSKIEGSSDMRSLKFGLHSLELIRE